MPPGRFRKAHTGMPVGRDVVGGREEGHKPEEDKGSRRKKENFVGNRKPIAAIGAAISHCMAITQRRLL